MDESGEKKSMGVCGCVVLYVFVVFDMYFCGVVMVGFE